MIESYLAQDVWRQAQSGVDANGQRIFGEPTQTRGRWLEKRRLVRNAEGEQVVSEVTVMFGPAEAVAVGDRLSRDGSEYMDVISILVSRGLGGEAALRRAYL